MLVRSLARHAQVGRDLFEVMGAHDVSKGLDAVRVGEGSKVVREAFVLRRRRRHGLAKRAEDFRFGCCHARLRRGGESLRAQPPDDAGKRLIAPGESGRKGSREPR